MHLKRIFSITAVSCLIVGVGLMGWYNDYFTFSEKLNTSVPPQFEEAIEEEEEEGIVEAMEYLKAVRYGDTVNRAAEVKAAKQVRKRMAQQAKRGKVQKASKWINLGPDNQGGRTRAIVVDQNNSDRIYAGGVSGGLWMSENKGDNWQRVESFNGFVTVNTMFQASDGDIYVGTGEGFGMRGGPGGSTGANSGHTGNGIYVKRKGTDKFVHLDATATDTTSNSNRWSVVYDIAQDPDNADHIYAGTQRGLMESQDGGETWNFAALPSLYQNRQAHDITFLPSGEAFAVVAGEFFASPNLDTFKNINDRIPQSSFSSNGYARANFATSPASNKIVYLAAVNNGGRLGQTHNIYRSADKGQSWEIIGPGDPEKFNPHGDQGIYNHAFEVTPDNPNKIFLGGQFFFYQWTKSKGWSRKATGFSPSPYRMHVDFQEITFDPNNPDIMYVGNDGGVYRSTDQGQTYREINKHYMTTQFYGLGVGPKGRVIGGTQDNGTHFLSYVDQNTVKNSLQVLGGDGASALISHINPDFKVAHIATGPRMLWATSGLSFQSAPLDQHIDKENQEGDQQSDGIIDDVGPYDFVTPIHLWETDNPNFRVQDSLIEVSFAIDVNPREITEGWIKKIDTLIAPPDTVYLYKKSKAMKLAGKDYYLPHVFYVGTRNLWATPQALTPTSSATWFKLASPSGDIRSVATSTDGNVVYVGTSNGYFMTLNGMKDLQWGYHQGCDITMNVSGGDTSYNIINCQGEDQFDVKEDGVSVNQKQIPNGGFITNVAVDPSDSNHVVVTVGQYSGPNKRVYRSTNAATTDPDFTSIHGNLPNMPAYDAVIHARNSDKIYVSTEFGVWRTTDPNGDSTEWVSLNNGKMDPVPTFQLEQIPNPQPAKGMALFASTHGRGFYAMNYDPCTDYEPTPRCLSGINESSDKVASESVLIYPNPMQDRAYVSFTLNQRSDVRVTVYNLKGERVDRLVHEDMMAGKQRLQLSPADYPSGVYVVRTEVGKEQYTNKISVTR